MFSASSSSSSDLDKMCGGLNLTRTQRFYGFGVCFGIGTLLSIISFLFLTNIPIFAVLYSFGNIISLIGTGFLVGFFKQFKCMFDSTRLIASCVFLGTLIITLVVAFTIKSSILCIVLCIIQYFALMWYSLSYIPFARDAVKAALKGIVGR